MAPKDCLLLVDGHAVLYRSYHALPPFRTKDGIPTNAVYGFVTTLFKAYEELAPKYCAIAFDVAGKTFRHKEYVGYKASRPATPPDLVEQVEVARQVAEALDIPVFTRSGYEADDIIGTLATQARAAGVPVVIVTGDKDAFQLVNDTTWVYLMGNASGKTQPYDRAAVRAKTGVWPTQVADFKALAGDASDEIPGVAGIGEKTATDILSQVASLDELYAVMASSPAKLALSPRIVSKLTDSEAAARQSQRLAKIICDVPIKLELESCLVRNYDPVKVSAIFSQLEFFSLLKRLPLPLPLTTDPPSSSEPPWRERVIRSPAELKKKVKNWLRQPYVWVDVVADTPNGRLASVALAADGQAGYDIPLVAEGGATVDRQAILRELTPLLTADKVAKIGHNLKDAIGAFDREGINLQPIHFDTMIAAYVLHAHLRTFAFDAVCQRERVGAPSPAPSAAGKAAMGYRLFERLRSDLGRQPKLAWIAKAVDFPLISVLYAMERRGVLVDETRLTVLAEKLTRDIGQIRAKIESYSPRPINVNSPSQLQQLLFEDLGLNRAGIKSIASGLSTAAAQLEKLRPVHPVIDDVLRYRELTKLLNTYVATLPRMLDAGKRLHTQFVQTAAATGRLSSQSPNLQNIPIRTVQGQAIRRAFIAPPGYSLVSLDYSQIELRVIAHLSGDVGLGRVFADGRDIHAEVAKQLGIDRRAAKAINFGIIYGLSPFGLSQSLKIDPKVAREYIAAYFVTYPKVADYLATTKKEITKQGYVETLFGRRREIPEIYAANAVVRAAAERMAINAPAQGTAADLIKLAMIRVHAWLEDEFRSKSLRPYLILQVHDELLLETPSAMSQTVARRVKTIMEGVADLAVPLAVNVAVGDNWGDLTDIDPAVDG